ncbi:hypothetical protein HMPREF1199_00028 [Hoylesella oralis CC98A]|nr:hypothetical protein HMPREF1199_00028 [Hoylesella oralis CC98A]
MPVYHASIPNYSPIIPFQTMNEDKFIPYHRRDEKLKEDRFFRIRNILNIIFIIGALIGLVLYFATDHTSGTIVILAAMVFKIVESCLRFFR